MRLFQLTLVAAVVAVGAPVLASASPITYTETDTVSGSLDGITFTDASILLTMNNDTTSIVGAPGFFYNVGTATVSINGGAPLNFSNTMEVFSNQGTKAVGFEQYGFLDVLDDVAAPFATYDLATSIGPTTGTPLLNPGYSFATSGGAFIITSAGDPTFSATTGATVPEPGSLGLLAMGLLSLAAVYGYRRRRI